MTPFDHACDVFEQAVGSEFSAFYRTLYGTPTPKRPRSLDEWQRLPFLTKEIVLDTPYDQRIFAPRHDVQKIRFTSGTGRRGIMAIPSIMPTWPDPTHYRQIEGARMLCFLYDASFIRARRAPEWSDRIIMSGDMAHLDATARLAESINLDSLYGSPSVIVSLAPHLSADARSKVRYIHLTAERCTATQRALLLSAYPRAGIVIQYGMMESGIIARTPETPLEEPYALELMPYYFAEVIDENGKSLPQNETGELVFTGFERCAFPMIRYRTGDKARLFERDGRSFVELFGRAEEDSVRVPGGEIVVSEIERTLAALFGDRVVDFECEVRDADPDRSKIQIFLRLFSGAKLNPSEAAPQISRELRINATRRYEDGIGQGLYAPLCCEIVGMSAPIVGKRQRLIDLR